MKSDVIIGGGFIRAEFAAELSKGSDRKIHLIEILPKLLYAAFDDVFCEEMERLLGTSGVNVFTNRRVISIDGEQQVASVTLDDGEKVAADLVLISVGARPSSKLAEDAGLRIVEDGSIWVDDQRRENGGH